MFNTILDCGHQMTNILNEIAVETGDGEIKEILARFTTDVIWSCAFGLECNCIGNPEAEFRKMGKRAFTQTVGDVIKMVRRRWRFLFKAVNRNCIDHHQKFSSFS